MKYLSIQCDFRNCKRKTFELLHKIYDKYKDKYNILYLTSSLVMFNINHLVEILKSYGIKEIDYSFVFNAVENKQIEYPNSLYIEPYRIFNKYRNSFICVNVGNFNMNDFRRIIRDKTNTNKDTIVVLDNHYEIMFKIADEINVKNVYCLNTNINKPCKNTEIIVL